MVDAKFCSIGGALESVQEYFELPSAGGRCGKPEFIRSNQVIWGSPNRNCWCAVY